VTTLGRDADRAVELKGLLIATCRGEPYRWPLANVISNFIEVAWAADDFYTIVIHANTDVDYSNFFSFIFFFFVTIFDVGMRALSHEGCFADFRRSYDPEQISTAL
jgi:hypothetical protein